MSESVAFDPKDHWDIRVASAQPGEWGGKERDRLNVNSTWVPAAATTSLLTVTMYFGYQLRSLALTSSPASRTRGMMLLAEALVAVPRILDNIHILSIWRRDGIQRPSLLLHDNNVPTVDIFITYCGEGVQLALDTVRATCALDYPSSRFRIIVLDDSGSQTLASALATNFKAFDNVHYTSRNEKISAHSKAGNLNWGLKYTALLVGGASDFLAVLDVDMIPTRDWLRKLFPHLLQNPRAALVSPPQCFYNTPEDDRYDEGGFFIRHLEVVASLLDRSGNSMCSGTGFIARRKSIDAIGGFPQSVAESVLTSWKLKADGWQSAYVFERVQWGLGPRTVQSYVRQCEKTAIGAASLMQHAAQPRGTEKKTVLSQIIAAKLMLLLYTTPYWTSTLNMVLVPCALLSGGLQSEPGLWQSIWTANMLGLADFAAQCIYGFTISSLTGGRLHVLNHVSTLWIAPHQLLALLLPHGFFKRTKSRQSQSYAPTNKSSDTENQVFNTALLRRLKSALVNDLAFVHCAVLLLCTTSASYWAYQILAPHGYLKVTTPLPALSHFILSLGWPPFLLVWTAYIANAWTPVSCLLFPPVRPARESLLVHDPITGAAYPSQQAKDNWDRKKGGWHLYIVVLYHVLVLFAMLFLPDLANTCHR